MEFRSVQLSSTFCSLSARPISIDVDIVYKRPHYKGSLQVYFANLQHNSRHQRACVGIGVCRSLAKHRSLKLIHTT